MHTAYGNIRRLVLADLFSTLVYVTWRLLSWKNSAKLRQIAEHGEVSVLLHVCEVLVPSLDSVAERLQRVVDVFFPLGDLLGGE